MAVAVGAFLFGEKLEKLFCAKLGVSAPNDDPKVRNRVWIGLGTAAALALGTIPLGLETSTKDAPYKPAHLITSVDLAKSLVSDPTRFYLLDLRPRKECLEGTIPGAACLEEGKTAMATVSELGGERDLVVFGQEEVPWKMVSELSNDYGHSTYSLRGGYHMFELRVLTKPRALSNPTLKDKERYSLLVSLNGHFTGKEVTATPVVFNVKKVKRKIKKGGGC